MRFCVPIICLLRSFFPNFCAGHFKKNAESISLYLKIPAKNTNKRRVEISQIKMFSTSLYKKKVILHAY